MIVFTKGELRLERLRIVGRGKSLFCFPPPGAALFFRLISDRYGRASTAITTNKSVKEWPGVFAGDQAVTAAILDRLLQSTHPSIPRGAMTVPGNGLTHPSTTTKPTPQVRKSSCQKTT